MGRRKRYATLAEMVADAKAGKLPASAVILLDNDDASAWANSDQVSTWNLDPRELLEQALDILGIKHCRP